MRQKFLVCSKGPFKPFAHTDLFSPKMPLIFSTFIKNAFGTNLNLVPKKKENFHRKVFKLQRFSKVFPMLVKTPYFGKNNVKWARTEFFQKLFVWDSTLPMNLKSVISCITSFLGVWTIFGAFIPSKNSQMFWTMSKRKALALEVFPDQLRSINYPKKC